MSIQFAIAARRVIGGAACCALLISCGGGEPAPTATASPAAALQPATVAGKEASNSTAGSDPSPAQPMSAPTGRPRQQLAEIKVLSNRADLISGGDALVQVSLSGGDFSAIESIQVGARDVRASFSLRPDGRYLGLVTGLANGPNVLEVRLADKSGARITITNHPRSGPVFSGPQVLPWTCNAGASDAQCTRAPTYQYFYVPAAVDANALPSTMGGLPGQDGYFQAYDPASPPPAAAIAQTTTDRGRRVPFIVRVETGSVGRGQYQVAVLFDSNQPWTVGNPQAAWNQKLFLIGGPNCGISYQEGSAPGVLYGRVLGRGFAVLSAALEVTGSNCNLVTQAEALLMAKEQFIETYGTVRYTMSVGGSGASLVQQWNANAYPGIYDGLIVEASFPDAWTEMINTEDCISLVDYWTNPARWGPGVLWSPAEQSFVQNGDAATSCVAFAAGFRGLFTPADETGQIPASLVYSQDNPSGVRGTLWDYSVSQLGRRPSSVWGATEQRVGMGFANRPLDTAGIQYGLKALQNGQVSAAQFVDMNAKVGGHDIDYNPQPQRTTADPAALATSYRSGYLNQANNLHVPIIDIRGTSNVEIHDTFHSWSMRARLERANGHHDNQVIWDSFTASGFVVDPQLELEALDLMDSWLSAIEADTGSMSLAQKVAANKPGGAVDRCTVPGTAIPAPCVIPASGTPRLGAGQPLTDDTAKCQLKAMVRTDYFPAIFTDPQWALLQQAFPGGVCDYSKPGVNQQPTLAWLTYTQGPGGLPLGAPPASIPFAR